MARKKTAGDARDQAAKAENAPDAGPTPKARARPKPAGSPYRGRTLSVKLPKDVVESARNISAIEDIPISDLLGDLLRPVLLERERAALARRASRIKEK